MLRAVRLKALGVAFLVVLALLLGLAVAVYNKAFRDYVPVTLKAGTVGNQLTPHADVKVRGILVGEVTDISVSDNNGATLQLELDPADIDLIPANVKARLLPKTLFGEKFVDLVIPDDPASESLSAGDVIPEDRSKSAIETSKVINDLLPLLRTLQPEKLNTTLAAISTALEGRGEALGENFALVDDYINQINPVIPTIQTDISGIADLAASLDAAAPDLLSFLDNTSFTARTLVDKQNALATFLRDTQGFAVTATRILADNEDRLIAVGQVSRPILALLAEYAPELPCLTKGLADAEPRIEDAFGGRQGPYLHLDLEIVKDQGAFLPTDGDVNYTSSGGPDCHGLPDPRTNPNQVGPPGLDQSNPFDPDADYGATDAQVGEGNRRPAVLRQAGIGPVGAGPEQALVGGLLAPTMGVPADEVPTIADLLFGPLARGAQVGYGGES